jgi:hypothetical protein
MYRSAETPRARHQHAHARRRASPSASAPCRTRGPSAATSSTGTAPTTITRASPCSRLLMYITAASNSAFRVTQNQATLDVAYAAHAERFVHGRPPPPDHLPRSGSTSQRRRDRASFNAARHSVASVNYVARCLKLVDAFRGRWRSVTSGANSRGVEHSFEMQRYSPLRSASLMQVGRYACVGLLALDRLCEYSSVCQMRPANHGGMKSIPGHFPTSVTTSLVHFAPPTQSASLWQ